jgi:hypothetical protein
MPKMVTDYHLHFQTDIQIFKIYCVVFVQITSDCGLNSAKILEQILAVFSSLTQTLFSKTTHTSLQYSSIQAENEVLCAQIWMKMSVLGWFSWKGAFSGPKLGLCIWAPYCSSKCHIAKLTSSTVSKGIFFIVEDLGSNSNCQKSQILILVGGERHDAYLELIVYILIIIGPLVLQLPWQEVIGMRLILKQSHTDQYLIIPGVAAALTGGDRYEADPKAITYRSISNKTLV